MGFIGLLLFFTNHLEAAEYSIGPVFHQFHYDEKSFATIHGSLWGLQAGAQYILSEQLGLRLDAKALQGSMTYDGYLSDAAMTPKSDPTEDFWYEGSAQICYPDWHQQGPWLAGGLKAARWQDRITGIGGYRRNTTHLLLELVGGWTQRLAEQWQISASLGAGKLVWGGNTSYFGDASSDFPAVYLQQSQGIGWKVELEASYRMWSYSGVKFSYGHESWTIGESKEEFFSVTTPGGKDEYSVVEPKNETIKDQLSLRYFAEF